MSQTVKLTLWLRSGLWLCTESTFSCPCLHVYYEWRGARPVWHFCCFLRHYRSCRDRHTPLYVVPFIDWPKQSWFCISLSFKNFFNNNNLTTWVAGLDGGIGGKEGMGVELGIGVTMGRRPRHLTPTTPVTVVPPLPVSNVTGKRKLVGLVGPQILFRKFIISK